MGDARLSSAKGGLSVAHITRSFGHQTTKGVDCNIAHPDAVLAALTDRPHRLPHRDVLVRDAFDACEVAFVHRCAVLLIEIVRSTDIVEVTIDVLAPF